TTCSRSTAWTRPATGAGDPRRSRMNSAQKREPRPWPGGVSNVWGVLFSESRAAREVLRTRPPICGGDEALDAMDPPRLRRVRLFFRVRPLTSDERSIARLARQGVRERSRFLHGMERLCAARRAGQ